MKIDRPIIIAVGGLAFIAAAGTLLGVPPQGLILALAMIVCTAAIVQSLHRRRDHREHHDPEVTVRRKHMHGQDTLSGPLIP